MAGNKNGQSITDSVHSMQQKLELQLHEQYAINNNATLSSMLSLFVSMLATLGGYGYVFINSTNRHLSHPVSATREIYTTDDLIFTTIAATIVLTAISGLCISTGYKGRMEQFVVYAIRKKYYTKPEYYKVFPNGYQPFKKGCYTSPIQDPYNTFFYLTSFIAVAINLASMYRTCFHDVYALATACACYFGYVVYKLKKSHCKYKKRCKERLEALVG